MTDATTLIDTNPLLDFSDLPRFDALRPEHVTPAIDHLLAHNRAVIAELETPITSVESVTWENFVIPLDNATEKLGRAWDVVAHLHSVMDTPEWRAAYNDNQLKITEFWTALGQNLALFEKYKALHASAAYNHFSATRKIIVQHALRDFLLSGAELPEAQKVRFAEIQEQEAKLSTQFSENVLDAINDYALYIEDEADLSGLPADIKQAAQIAAQADKRNGFKFTLQAPSYFPILQFADKRALRETIYRANSTKASELGRQAKWDNTPHIAQLLKLRNEAAKLLGYRNAAEVSLVPKMAQTPQQVIHFLEDLAQRARPYAEKDLAEVRTFAQNTLGLPSLEAWDTTYASEKLREQRYAFSEQDVKQYFPEPIVIQGLFRLAQTLFAIDIKPDSAPTWHPDVKFFRIEKNGELIGQFYLDLYARASKRSGAWMNDARSRRRTDAHLQTPIAYLVCNFTAPLVVEGKAKPALFTHDEVMTLFHEFGHGLHHLLTQVDEISVSGLGGVEWDAVELPSQLMENFCWEWEVLQQMTAHIDNGQPLPRELFDKMIAAKNFQSGLHMLRQIELSLIDIHLHDGYDPNGQQSVQQLIDQVRQQVAVIVPPAYNRFQNSFTHIFSGGYSAGYYSYKWAEVLSADVYSAFEEAAAIDGSILSTKVGQKLQQEILAVGGSRPALESFKAFRGREPSIDALLRHSGLTGNA